MFLLRSKRRFYCAHDESEPYQKAGKQQDLPTSSEIDVLVTLMAPVERDGVRQAIGNRQPLTAHGSSDYNQQCEKKNIDTDTLALWLGPTNQRSYEQTCGKPRGRDPEYAE